MTADQTTPDQPTTDQPTSPADDQPKPGYKRVKMEAHYFDVKIEPDPLSDQVFGYVGGEASRFDQYAAQLYADAVKLVEDLKRADGSFADPYNAAEAFQPTFNSEAVHTLQQRIDAYYCAISNLRQAANQLRAAKLALSPYVDPTLLTRAY